MRVVSAILICLLTLSSCEEVKRQLMTEAILSQKKKKPPLRNGEKVAYYKGTKIVRSRVNFVEGSREGKAEDFYKDGQLRLSLNYHNNEKHGESNYYFENGQLYKQSNYRAGKLDGPFKVYDQKGRLKAEGSYKEDWPCFGLKEYNRKGKELKDFPQIKVKYFDYLDTREEYVLQISLDKSRKDVKFYISEHDISDCFAFDFDKMQMLYAEDGIVNYPFDLPKGMGVSVHVYIYAVYSTSNRVKRVVKKPVNFEISNPA
ncbi:hypothetical protein [Persicobacter diffluens]|uniref:Toxin-antitoxin system YwqK family antitoxin n=1 Tax=Persicobacter diffluens TaxID=981 RepID=A0AAN4W0V1_9BACT|nr:hypothetical protein PEDI_33910 [Persicobacter diffluens]